MSSNLMHWTSHLFLGLGGGIFLPSPPALCHWQLKVTSTMPSNRAFVRRGASRFFSWWNKTYSIPIHQEGPTYKNCPQSFPNHQPLHCNEVKTLPPVTPAYATDWNPSSASYLFDDVFAVVISQCTAQFVIIHPFLVFTMSPSSRDFLAVVQFEFPTRLVRPFNQRCTRPIHE